MPSSVPVLYIIFNRPEITRIVFERIRSVQPKQLFIAADGPRKDKEGEAELCAEARTVLGRVDWDCEVQTYFREENAGCAKNVSEAISWFFDQVEEGIILEDDCLPDPSFFPFCETLLEKYKADKSIGAICGSNAQLGISRTAYSYFFAQLFSSWGWATWKDRWQQYQILPAAPNLELLRSFRPGLRGWIEDIQHAFRGEIDSWAYKWQYTIIAGRYSCIYPNVSLIRNIGFAEDASHTQNIRWWYPYVRYGSVSEIRHPGKKKISREADDILISVATSSPFSWKNRWLFRLKRIQQLLFKSDS